MENSSETPAFYCYKKPMHIAAQKGDTEAIVALAKSGVKISEVENGQTPLHLALIEGKTLAARKLISLGANLSKKNKNVLIPLHLAVLHDHVSLIDHLIDRDSENNVDTFDLKGNTALHIAVLLGKVDAVHALLVGGADADRPNKGGDAPLHMAIIQGNSNVLDVVLEYVDKPNILDKNECRPLHLAVLHHKTDVIRKIGELANVKVNYLNGDGDSALHLASKFGNLAAIEELHNLGANMNLKNSKGFSPIHLAVIYDKPEAMESLVLFGAQIDGTDRLRNTPVHLAAIKNNIHALRILNRYRANVNLRNASGNSPLHCTVLADCRNAFRLLLHFGANINILNGKGMTPLHIAVCLGNKDIIEMLIRYGASVHCLDAAGNKPLHSAAIFCNSVGIATLIEHGAKLSMENKDSLTALDIILQYVRENTFKTAMKNVTDLYKKRNLKREFPLSLHEILKSAKLIIKFEILRNCEHSKLNIPKYLSKIIPILKSYINDCFAEVRLMKSTMLHENFSFYEFVTTNWVDSLSFSCAYGSEVALNHILDVSTTKGYPICHDLIISRLERPALWSKVLCLRIHAKHNGKTTFVDLDVVPLIVKHLSNDDILNLLIAYSGLDLDIGGSECSNVNKRKKRESKLGSSSVNKKHTQICRTIGSRKTQLSKLQKSAKKSRSLSVNSSERISSSIITRSKKAKSLKNSVKTSKKRYISVATKSIKFKRSLSSTKATKGNRSPSSAKVSKKNYSSSVVKTAKETFSVLRTRSKKGKGYP